VVLAQLIAGTLFFAVGLDRQVLRLFAYSLERIPAGTYHFWALSAQPLIGLGAALFRWRAPGAAGGRPAFDARCGAGAVGRLNQQLQLLHMAFPAKMLTALLALSWLAALFPRILLDSADRPGRPPRQMLGI